MNERLRNARLVVLACAALLLFTYPLVAVFDTGRFVGGVPLVVVYLFVAWGAVIALAAWIGRRP